jgi:TetR/AcrR family transcriptional regulator, lmrAB and yxaGH operons repressor
MIEGAVKLLALHGLQATSFSEVLEVTGAPRGSIYHHFPEGKDQPIAAAVELAGSRALEPLDQLAGAPPEEIATFFLGMWRRLLSHTQFDAGCAVLAVTIATDSRELLDHAGAVFRSWRGRLTELFNRAAWQRGMPSNLQPPWSQRVRGPWF